MFPQPPSPARRRPALAVLCAALALLPACHLAPMSKPTVQTSARFELSSLGSVRHWLVAGPHKTLYDGPPGPDHVRRRDALDYSTAIPPAAAALGEPGPFGSVWTFHDPGRNEFVEFSTFYREPTVVEYYAFTEIDAPGSGEWTGRLWVAGAVDLWVNGDHLTRLNVTRYRNPDSQPVTLPLKKGLNRLCVRLQCLGLRDTRILFGLWLDQPAGVTVVMPKAARIAEASRWIDTVRALRPDGLDSTEAAPFAARVVSVDGPPVTWPAGASTFAFAGDRPATFNVETSVDGVVLQRILEIPGNRPPVAPVEGDRRTAQLDRVALAGIDGQTPAAWNAAILPVLARRLLGRTAGEDAAAFAAAINEVDQRRDCGDFALAGLLRLELLGLATPKESAEIRRAALAFRYWMDEPGTDAMCFDSENHTLLFRGCQLIAGQLYPEDIFGNSGRTGREQAALALPPIRKWLDHIEARGFEEFNSSTYMPITIAAMLNVVDFSRDEELSTRMSAQIDRIYRDLARHEFDGAVISPQGRVYRDVLHPDKGGTQTLLAYATDATDVDLPKSRAGRDRGTGDWIVFPASSPRYHPPKDLAAKISEPVSRTDRHADFQIVLEKTPAYILTSLAVPAIPRPGEHPQIDLRPGGAGYQQHLWQATIGPDCHVFVNHPGCFMDWEKTSRPGYWYGNGLLPRVRQEGNWLQAIYVIPDGTKTEPKITPSSWEWPGPSTARPFDLYPVAFTHVYWPSDAFDRQERRGHWIFGQKGRGLVGLWCSEPLVPHDDVMTGRELRANGHASAWLVVCGDTETDGSLEKFMTACEARAPSFDRERFILSMQGATPTRWWERSEPMPR